MSCRPKVPRSSRPDFSVNARLASASEPGRRKADPDGPPRFTSGMRLSSAGWGGPERGRVRVEVALLLPPSAVNWSGLGVPGAEPIVFVAGFLLRQPEAAGAATNQDQQEEG